LNVLEADLVAILRVKVVCSMVFVTLLILNASEKTMQRMPER
jgi:hypothetical protein